jgi:hypothetical protein
MSALHLAAILKDLASVWAPHPAQRQVLNALFTSKRPVVLAENGRKWGKTEVQVYTLTRWALTRPGAYYYFAPFKTQAREILWSPGRLQSFLGPHVNKYIESVGEQDMRVTFRNGSFIKVDGTENYDAYRGVNPHGIVIDEFKDHRYQFWDAMEPNLATHQATAFWAGTPSETDEPFIAKITAMARECSGYYNFPTDCNPHISKEWLANKKRQLYAAGDGAVWEREYMARRVFGGSGAIIPMFDRSKHVRRHDELVEELKRDWHKFEWIITCDPGTASVFAVLLSCYNPYRKTLYHLDCMYLESQAETSVSYVIPRLQALRLEYPEAEDWLQVYDEAASWFAGEAAATYDEHFIPTRKAQHKKEEGLSLIKDQCLNDRVFISDRCEKLAWEVENYVRDQHGRIPKKRDHLIDCWRYANAALAFDLVDGDEPEVVVDDRRGFTPEQDWKESRGSDFDPCNDVISMEDEEW